MSGTHTRRDITGSIHGNTIFREVQRFRSRDHSRRETIHAMERHDRIGLSIDELLERRQHQLAARLRLGLMKQLERLVDNLARLPERTDLAPERVEFWRMTWRTQYEQAIGVSVEQRDLLRTCLQQIAESGATTVERIVLEVRQAHRNRFAGGGGGDGGVAV